MTGERAENKASQETESTAPEADTEATPADAPQTESEPGGEAPPEAANDAGPAPEPTPEEVIADLKDRLLRAVAETENTRRRGAREAEDARRYAIASFARDMLAVADNLRRAIDAVPDNAREENQDLANLLTGVELTERELLKAFERAGISKIDPLGEKLDPHLHQAMMQVPDETAAPGTVVQVIQVGYKVHDRLLRPAMVGVATGPAASSGQQVDTEA